MKIIDRYVGRQVLISAALAVAVLSVVLVLGNIFKMLLDVLVKGDAPLELVLSVIAYILPFSLVFTIPWGFLTAVLLVFGKMSAENELVALRSNGLSIARVCAPVTVLAVVCVAICLWINLDVAPRAQQRMKDAVVRIATSDPLSLFKSDKVIDEFPGRKIFVERHDGSALYNLLVYELGESSQPINIVFARRGELKFDYENQQVLMRLFDARMALRDEGALDDLMKIDEGVIAKELVLPIPLKALKARNVSLTAAGTERSKRYSFSLASLAFALIGVPMAITAHRKETSVGFGLSMAIAFTYFIGIIVVDWVRDKPEWHPEILVWSPNVLFMGLGIGMFYCLNKK